MTITQFYIIFFMAISVGLINFYLFYLVVKNYEKFDVSVEEYSFKLSDVNSKNIDLFYLKLQGISQDFEALIKNLTQESIENINTQSNKLFEINSKIENNLKHFHDELELNTNQLQEIRKLNAIIDKKNKQIERLKRK